MQTTPPFGSFWVIESMGAAFLIGVLLLQFINAGDRVASIDQQTIYADFPHIDSAFWNGEVTYKKRRVDFGYHIYSTETLAVKEMKRQAAYSGPAPTVPLGNEAFYTNGMSGTPHLVLFRRLNVVASFLRNQNVESAATDQLDKQEIEDIAGIFDQAIVRREKSVAFQRTPLSLALWTWLSTRLPLPEDPMAIFCWPIFIDFGLAVIFGAFFRQLSLRFLACPVIALVVGFISSGPHALLFESGESGGWAQLGFLYLTGWGVIPSGIGLLVGRRVRQLVDSMCVSRE